MVCAVIFLEYLRPQDHLPFLQPLRLPFLMTVAVGLLWLTKGDKRPLKDPLIRLYVAFTVLVAASALWAVNTYMVFQSTKILLLYLFTVTVPFVAFVKSAEGLGKFFRVWVVIHVLLVLASLGTAGRGSGSFLEDENDLALAFNMVIPYAYFLFQSPRSRGIKKLLLLAAMVILVVGVVNTNSRGGFLGLVTVLGAAVLLSEHRVRNFAIIAVLSGLVALAVPSTYWTEVETISDKEDSTRTGRLHLWAMGWEIYKDHPVLGVGASNFSRHVFDYEIEAAAREGVNAKSHWGVAAHSLYFTLLPEGGTVGSLLYALMAILVVTRARRAKQLLAQVQARAPAPDMAEMGLISKALLSSLLAYFVCGAFISVLYYPHFWFLIGFIISIERLAARRLHTLSRENTEAGP